MSLFKYLYIILLAIFISACSFGKKTLDLNELNKIKKVAVVMYTTPTSITYKSDPRDSGKKSLLAIVAETASADNGSKAAGIAHKTFTQTLGSKKLPFTVLSHSNTVQNRNFMRLYSAEPAKPAAPKGGVMGFLSSMGGGDATQGAAPANINQYGLTTWNSDSALTKKQGEMKYIKDAMNALKVDAVLIINDPGFSFVCEVCVAQSGAASTGSAFNATMINRAGHVVLNIREWFATTDAQAAMVGGAVNPLQHDALFEEHGRKMANVFADALREGMSAK